MAPSKSPSTLKSQSIVIVIRNVLTSRRFSSNSKLVLPPSLATDIISMAYKLQLCGQVTTLQYNDLIRTFGSTLTSLVLELTDAYCGESTVTLLEVTRNVLRTVAEPTDPLYFKNLTIYGHWLPWKMCDLSRTLSFTRGLTSLTLYIRNLNDVIIKAIAISCRDLEHLSLEGTQFTDCAIKALAGYIWTSGKRDIKAIGTPKLRTLMFTESEHSTPFYTEHSICTLLDEIRTVQSIYLPTDHVTQAIHELSTIKPGKQLNLTKFKGNSNCLKSIVTSCPLLETVELIVDTNYDIDKLVDLNELNHLHSIALHSPNHDFNSYHFEFCNALTSLSPKLCHLEIHLPLELDLITISRQFHNLVHLELTNVLSLRTLPINRIKKPMLVHLEHLKLMAHSDNKITELDLIQLLENCFKLKYLFIGWIEGFSDHLIDSVLTKNPLENLKQIELHETGPNLTTIGLTQLIFSLSNLVSIHLMSSEAINAEEAQAINCLINESNLDVAFNYQPW
ncbi:hypothetical protein HDE_09219 [Halotydeus destructor]|nr:hypothetical protein HDE_09219 [Halotydeus destructor]